MKIEIQISTMGQLETLLVGDQYVEDQRASLTEHVKSCSPLQQSHTVSGEAQHGMSLGRKVVQHNS